MVKNKTGGLAKLPREQKCKFLLGPIGSWFMPSALDVWTAPDAEAIKADKASVNHNVSQDNVMECDSSNCEDNSSSSYLIYGSIGCFCYGKISHRQPDELWSDPNRSHQESTIGAKSAVSIHRLIDVKEDNSRISCVRFLRTASYPIAMILTESGSLVVHDCELSENVIHYKKSELTSKLVDPSLLHVPEESSGEHFNKKPRFNVTQQINSCVWPNARNAFIGISLLREKTNLVCWLNMKDLTAARKKGVYTVNKTDLIESSEMLDLNLVGVSSPICCMESTMLSDETCLVATAQDDGLIVVAKVNFNTRKLQRVIKLDRHNDQVCSLSLFTGNPKKFPSGLLASSSRNGLVLVWDIENEFYFADYQAALEGNKMSSKINWFALTFIHSFDGKLLSLAVGNLDSGVTVLDIPENIRSKIRLKELKEKNTKHRRDGDQTHIRHHALIFNLAFDPVKQVLVSSSLDGNHIVWNCNDQVANSNANKKTGSLFEVKASFLYPSMTNNSRTHMMRFSPIKEDFLGLALGKAGVKFYRIAKDVNKCRFDMSFSCAIVHRMITKANLSPTSISWNPTHEYRLALGTIEGKILRVDLTPRKASFIEAQPKNRTQLKKPPKEISKQPDIAGDILDVDFQPLDRSDNHSEDGSESFSTGKHSKTDGIYSICWGPNPTCPQDLTRLAIYAIGSITNRLFIYHSKKENADTLTNFLDEFMDQSLPEAIGEASEVAWKSSMDLMAVGTTTGKVIIAKYLDEGHEGRSKDYLFMRLAVIQGAFSSPIQCLAWHPSTDKSNDQYFSLAISANESPVFIYNLKDNLLAADVRTRLKIDDGGYDYSDYLNTSIVATYLHKLDLHTKTVSDIQWSPHEPNEIATSSFDRTCYLWRLPEVPSPKVAAKAVSKFSARDRLFTLEWSLVQEDLIYTSGHDSTIWAWRPSDNKIKDDTQLPSQQQ